LERIRYKAGPAIKGPANAERYRANDEDENADNCNRIENNNKIRINVVRLKRVEQTFMNIRYANLYNMLIAPENYLV
jgi:hypothetical protein